MTAGLGRLWAGLFLLFLVTAHGNLESADSGVTLQAARALWLRGDSGLRTAEQGAEWEAEARVAAYVRTEAQRGVHVYGKVGAGDRVYVWFPIGHVWLMLPLVAAGEALQQAFPGVEARYRERAGPLYAYGEHVFDQALVAMTLPALFGATSVVLLWLLASAFGAARRDATIGATAIAFGTQFFPLARETLSDGPGLCFLLAALLAVVRADRGAATRLALVGGGFAAGAAVLTRYQHGVVVPVLGLALLFAARRQRRWSMLWWFALGGLPCLVLLLATNAARFHDAFDTGYPRFDTWFNYPVWFGVTKLLIAAGKGILWLSPLLWLALPLGVSRRNVPQLRWLAWTMFAIPMLMFGSTNGWQSGQCWGARYVTPGVVVLLAIVLPQARPWRSWPRTFSVLFALGVVANVTSVIAPTRGHNQLAGQAVRAMYRQELEAGRIGAADFRDLDAADHYFFLPRFSPLHANWTYARLSLAGAFEDEAQRARDGAAHTIEPMFGIAGDEPQDGRAPVHWEDRGFRHLWFVFWGALLGVPWWLLALPVAAAAGAVSWGSLRRLSRD